MLKHRFGAVIGLAVALALDLTFFSLPAAAESQSAGASGDQVKSRQTPPAALPPARYATASPPPKKGVGAKVKAALSKTNAAGLIHEREYKTAEAVFPAFCRRWERLLRERERNNLDHIEWRLKDGYQTGVYTGYGRIESCACKKSAGGFAIGKLTYAELKYYVAGKRQEDAKRSKPAVFEIRPTTELFRWDHGEWFY